MRDHLFSSDWVEKFKLKNNLLVAPIRKLSSPPTHAESLGGTSPLSQTPFDPSPSSVQSVTSPVLSEPHGVKSHKNLDHESTSVHNTFRPAPSSSLSAALLAAGLNVPAIASGNAPRSRSQTFPLSDVRVATSSSSEALTSDCVFSHIMDFSADEVPDPPSSLHEAVHTTTSPEEALRALKIVHDFFKQQPKGYLDFDESIYIGKFMEKLRKHPHSADSSG